MDVYTTSFTYPRRSRHIHSPASSLDFQPSDLKPSSLLDPFPQAQHLQHPNSNLVDVPVPADAEAVQKLVMMAMSLHGCHVSYYLVDQGRGWNFHISGTYQQVMITRGLILKECPIQVSLFHTYSRATH
jgi:hypothetical protein